MTNKTLLQPAISVPSKQQPNNQPTVGTLLHIFGVDKLHVQKL
jgi:hypothetical protein